jgi:hypothetical protein
VGEGRGGRFKAWRGQGIIGLERGHGPYAFTKMTAGGKKVLIQHASYILESTLCMLYIYFLTQL